MNDYIATIPKSHDRSNYKCNSKQKLIKHNVRGTYSSVRGMNERLKSICAESPPYILKESIITCPSQKQKNHRYETIRCYIED